MVPASVIVFVRHGGRGGLRARGGIAVLQDGLRSANTSDAASVHQHLTEVDRLRWRVWNGKTTDAQLTLERIREVMPAFQGERGRGSKSPSARRLWTALHEIDRYLSSQSAWLINYAGRHGPGSRSIDTRTSPFVKTVS